MSSSTFVGNPDGLVVAGPPPPPPPPPVPGQLPAMRISTGDATPKRPQAVNNDSYEPPAAIQNAMLTKDKKPFTYTPGMGGKLDLSQIRSPRMARRVAKNANDEGIEGPPKAAIEKTSPAATTAPNPFVQPQVAVPVFPTNAPPQPAVNRLSQSPAINKTPSNAADKQAEPAKKVVVTKVDTTKAVPAAATSNQSTPESPSTPTQITLTKAPTPWLQNKNKPQEELPEWAKRTSVNKATGSPSENTATMQIHVVQPAPQQQMRPVQVKQRQEQEPIQQPQQQSAQQQYQQQPRQQQHWQNADSATARQANQQHERVIPIRIEDRPSVFDVKRESGHHQFKQPAPTLHHQQRWGQVSGQQAAGNQNRPQEQELPIHVAASSRPVQQPAGTTYIIPLVVEGSEKKTTPSNTGNRTIVQVAKPTQQPQHRAAAAPAQQYEPGPIQSRSFRVLQKITDTDSGSNDVAAEQIRKMELSEDEKILMNKFKEQVDHETYLHQEEDPRYRGAAIPSRAFRFLQNMTDSNDASVNSAAPRNAAQNVNKRQNRNSKSFEETQANLPPSEQQVQEPRKYMGSAIPSRSFRILQAMTAPESIATQENRQADYTRRTENNLPGNQQGILLPPPSVPIWYPEGWWGYYPVQYSAQLNEPANEANELLPSYLPYAYPRFPHDAPSTYVGYESFYSPAYGQNATNVAPASIDSSAQYASYGYGPVAYPRYDDDDDPAVQPQPPPAAFYSNHCHDPAADHSPFVRNDSGQIGESDTVTGVGGTTLLPNEMNHLDAHVGSQSSGTCSSARSVRRSEDETNGIVMNIIDEEKDNVSAGNIVSRSADEENSQQCKTLDLRVNVPNYTYVDTSDSSESSDSSDCNDSGESTSDNEHLSEDPRRDHQADLTVSNDTSSDSDSDSYLAYSTGMNPYEKLQENSCFDSSVDATDTCPSWTRDERECDSESNGSTCSGKMSSENSQYDHAGDRDSNVASEQDTATKLRERNPDLRSDETSTYADREAEHPDQDSPLNDDAPSTIPHQLSVIYENMERSDSESPYCESKRDMDERKETSIEESTEDEPADDAETTMVSVSLPLRFKFFVSEDNEDVTTVTVGDSRIKEEKPKNATKNDGNADGKTNDVRVNFHVGNDTSVDFTLVKRHVTSDDTCATTCATPHVDFTLRRDFSVTCDPQADDCERRTAKEDPQPMETETESMSSKDDDGRTGPESMTRDTCEPENRKHTDNRELSNDSETTELGEGEGERATAEPESSAAECFWTQEETPRLRIVHTSCSAPDEMSNQPCTLADSKDGRQVDSELCQINGKHLLSVQDSREDTDDEDSGVTSDLSRMISEVDTDSECASSKNLKRYQRTQTHSRLFRLLNDDTVLTNCSDYAPKTDSSCRKEYLSLPLKPNVFNYDDSYCSNYSSGLTSPEYSPVLEQSWRRSYESSSEGTAADRTAAQSDQPTYKSDPYFRAWKNNNTKSQSAAQDHNVMPSLAFKTLDSRMPSWAYKVNVLCPRIKSTKNVPHTMLTAVAGGGGPAARQPAATTTDGPLPAVILPPPIPSCTNANTDYYC